MAAQRLPGGTRAAPSGNRCSSTSRSVGGRRRRVGMHSTRRAACRSIQSRRGAVANTMDGNDERDKSIGEGSPARRGAKVPDKAIRDARGWELTALAPAGLEGISIPSRAKRRQSEGRQRKPPSIVIDVKAMLEKALNASLRVRKGEKEIEASKLAIGLEQLAEINLLKEIATLGAMCFEHCG